MTEKPHVSIIIPTRSRPELLKRALTSVLSQTHRDWEAVVVVDGRDEATEALLEKVDDSRVRFVVNDTPRGGSEARNIGVRVARGEWIALLDDDDEWTPRRLERQLATLPADVTDDIIGFCRLVARAPYGDYLWPRRGPRPGEPVSEFLFDRRSLLAGEGGIQTSAIIAPRGLFQRVAFDGSLRRYQDTDWVLRASSSGAKLNYCPEPLVIWHFDEERESIGSAHQQDWMYAREWARARRDLMTRRAYAAFLLIRGGGLTSAALSLTGARVMLIEAFRIGQPSFLHLLLFAGKWAIRPGLRRRIRAITRLRHRLALGG